jgi:hypothetical protein
VVGYLSTAVVIADPWQGLLPNVYQTGEPTRTDKMMSLRTLLKKSADADLLLEMVRFAVQRLMELEVESLTGAAHGERCPTGSTTATATAIATGRPERAPSSCASLSPGRGATSRRLSSRAGWPRRRWLR